MVHFVGTVADYLFGCHHKALSRVFTIRHRTYQVCCDCGAEFEYSLKTMSAKRAWTLGALRVCAKDTETGTPTNQYQPIF